MNGNPLMGLYILTGKLYLYFLPKYKIYLYLY